MRLGSLSSLSETKVLKIAPYRFWNAGRYSLGSMGSLSKAKTPNTHS